MEGASTISAAENMRQAKDDSLTRSGNASTGDRPLDFYQSVGQPHYMGTTASAQTRDELTARATARRNSVTVRNNDTRGSAQQQPTALSSKIDYARQLGVLGPLSAAASATAHDRGHASHCNDDDAIEAAVAALPRKPNVPVFAKARPDVVSIESRETSTSSELTTTTGKPRHAYAHQQARRRSVDRSKFASGSSYLPNPRYTLSGPSSPASGSQPAAAGPGRATVENADR